MINSWMYKYELAKRYRDFYGNLLIPARFKTNDGVTESQDGLTLGVWIRDQRLAYNGIRGNISKERIDLLEEIGMSWDGLTPTLELKRQRKEERENKIKQQKIENKRNKWMDKYNYAKAYYIKNGHLQPIKYYYINEDGQYDENGFDLYNWINYQRHFYKEGKLNFEQISLLKQIGMTWDAQLNKYTISNEWLEKYELAKNYKEFYGDLLIPARFKTTDGIKESIEGINLGMWIRDNRIAYNGVRGEINDLQIGLLEKIGMVWNVKNDLEKEKITNENTKRKQIELLNRTKSYLLKYKSNTLPNKEEINKGFSYYLSK